MASIWPANALTGGGAGALDAIDGALLSNGDGAVVIAGSKAYFYSLNATSAADESSPEVIAPDVNAGDKRWILQDIAGADLVEVIKPENQSPADNATGVALNPDLSATNYYSLYGKDQQASQWQISTASDFATTVEDATAGAVTTYTVSGQLDALTTYHWRVRYQDADSVWSDWSEATSFETADIYTQTPTNQSPADTETDIGETPTLSADAFNCVNGSDTHASSDWEVYSDSELTDLVWSSYDDESNLESISVPEGNLSDGSTTYYWRCRYTGATYGDSEWSAATSFTTKASFVTVYGIALVSTGGGAGSWQWVDADGNDITLSTTDFDNHPVWGGIEDVTIDGQDMVKIPKFYYKVGDAPSGSDQAGKKCWWAAGSSFTGASVHPAFMDGGVEIDQFWMGAYEASDDGGTTVKSVSGVEPLADVSFDDFVTKIEARNTGGVDGFHMPDIHELGAIQILALIEMGTPDAQSAIGVGNDTGSVNNTGVDNDVYRGIYQLWSNVFMWVDGLRTTTDETIKIYDNEGNQTWVVIDSELTENRADWVVTMKESSGTDYDLKGLFIADTFDGTEANGTYADKQYLYKPSSEDYVCRHGGYWSGDANYGLFVVNVSITSSITNTSYGARLAKR